MKDSVFDKIVNDFYLGNNKYIYLKMLMLGVNICVLFFYLFVYVIN